MPRKILLGVIVFGLAGLAWYVGPGQLSAKHRLAESQLSDARAILEHADRFELYSVHPYPPSREPGDVPATQPAPEEFFRGYKIYGKILVSDRDVRRRLTAGLRLRGSGMEARCFVPRHAIYATRGGRQVDLLVCFECARVLGELDGQRLDLFPDRNEEPFYDQLLVNAGVPLAPKEK